MLAVLGVLTFFFSMMTISTVRADELAHRREEMRRSINIKCRVLPIGAREERISKTVVELLNQKAPQMARDLRMRAYCEIEPHGDGASNREIRLTGSTRLETELRLYLLSEGKIDYSPGYDESCLQDPIAHFVILPKSFRAREEGEKRKLMAFRNPLMNPAVYEMEEDCSTRGSSSDLTFSFQLKHETGGARKTFMLPVAGYYPEHPGEPPESCRIWCHFGTLDDVALEMQQTLERQGIFMDFLIYDLYEFELPSAEALQEAYSIREELTKKSIDLYGNPVRDYAYKLLIDDSFYLHEMKQIDRYVQKERIHITVFIVLMLASGLGLHLMMGVMRSRTYILMRTLGLRRRTLICFVFMEEILISLFSLGMAVFFTRRTSLFDHRYSLVSACCCLAFALIVTDIHLRRNLLLEVKKHTTE